MAVKKINIHSFLMDDGNFPLVVGDDRVNISGGGGVTQHSR